MKKQLNALALVLAAVSFPARADFRGVNPIAEGVSISKSLSLALQESLKHISRLATENMTAKAGNPDAPDGMNVFAALAGSTSALNVESHINFDGSTAESGGSSPISLKMFQDLKKEIEALEAGNVTPEAVIDIITTVAGFFNPPSDVMDIIKTASGLAAQGGANVPSSVGKAAEENAMVVEAIKVANAAEPPSSAGPSELNWSLYGPYVQCDVVAENKNDPTNVEKLSASVIKHMLTKTANADTENRRRVANAAAISGSFGRAIGAIRFVDEWKNGRQDAIEFVSDNTPTTQANFSALRGTQVQTYNLATQWQLMETIGGEILGMQAIARMPETRQ